MTTTRRGSAVTVRASAKVNLSLEVGPVDDAGFHRLVTVYQAVGLYDDLTATPAEAWSVHLTADDPIDVTEVPAGEENLAVRAGMMLAEHHGADPGDLAARLDIHKGIPVMGGLAGGSADAAAALVALDRLHDLQTSDDDLLALAARLGSDVPFALIGGTAVGTGRGEKVAAVTDHGQWWWVVVGSRTGLSTPQVYRRFDEQVDQPGTPALDQDLVDALAIGDPDSLAEVLHNDLQAPAVSLRPELAGVLEDGLAVGALASLLSGSGPTVLLLCEEQGHAHDVHQAMAGLGHELLTVVPAPVAGAHVLPTAL